MIKFDGKISSACKNFIIKQIDKSYLWLLLGFPFSFFFIGGVFLAIGYKLVSLIIGIALFVIFLIFSIFPRMHYNPKDLEMDYPNNVVIEDNYIITNGCGNRSFSSRKIDDIKKIIDYGDFYYVKYYFPFYRFTLCQKDLITKGTIEEFEQMFEEYIVRKIPKL